MCSLGAGRRLVGALRSSEGGGARMGPSSMLAGDMLSQVSRRGQKARRVHSVTRASRGFYQGRGFSFSYKGLF